MIARVLLAVDDTSAGFAAARVAIDLASDTGATVRAVLVVPAGHSRIESTTDVGRPV